MITGNNPNKLLDWTIGAQICRDLHIKYQENACKYCPLFDESLNSKFGTLETLGPGDNKNPSLITCNMFKEVVSPLVKAEVEVKPKDQMSYDYYKATGIYKYF